MNIVYVVILLLFGIGMLMAEILLIPGMGFAGLVGVGGIAAATVMAYMQISSLAGHIVLSIGVLSIILGIYWTIHSKAVEKMSLDTKIDSSVKLAEPGKRMEEMKTEDNK